jgi:23S rRNA (adenine2503-C2)-methyltransferase
VKPTHTQSKLNWLSLSKDDLKAQCHEVNRNPIHAHQLYKLTYAEGIREPWRHHSIPKVLQSHLTACCEDIRPVIIEGQRSRYDDSIKFRIRLRDGLQIETVLMPETKRLTLCVSTQVGCRQGCRFCDTGRMGLLRNLKADEIVGQITAVNQWILQTSYQSDLKHLKLPSLISNVVMMGMGEPLDNVPEVLRMYDIVTAHSGLQMSRHKISVSTAGHLDGIKELLDARPDVNLALSLHTPFEQERSALMPINIKWPLKTVLDYLRSYSQKSKQGLFIQYTVIDKVNDSDAHALELIKILQGVHAKINLIPYNPQTRSKFRPPTNDSIERLKNLLHQAGFRVMIRYSKGQDIGAACGQLIKKQKPPARSAAPSKTRTLVAKTELSL